VCLEDGHCAGQAEAIYVQNRAECSGTFKGAGTAGDPFCSAKDGAAALSTSKRLLVLRGPRDWPIDEFSLAFAGAPVTVVGRGAAVVAPLGVGAAPLIVLSVGDASIRDLEVAGGRGTGILATGGTLHISRCTVLDNKRGGIEIDGAGFDINNVIVARNGGVTEPGIKLLSGSPAPAAPTRLWNATVVQNGSFGVQCGTAGFDLRSLLVSGNRDGSAPFQVDSICGAASHSSTAPPDFDPGRPFRLRATSPCVDQGDPAQSPSDDIDGNPRPSPAGGRSDCGAHELQK
jgi:hypothetical protein